MEHQGEADKVAEVAESVGNDSGEWSTMQRELQRDAPELADEATGILKALIARVRVRKAMRSYGIDRPLRIAAA